MAAPLDSAALSHALSAMDGWAGDRYGITRTVELPSFPAAIAVVDRVAEIAEELDHHPDIDIRWRTLTFRLVTYAAGNLVTDRDLTLARKIDTVLAEATSAK
jgi:4a-hydroxytetrahydrobiopterin dehydratase